MVKKNKVEVVSKEEKVVRLNLNYLDFIKEIKDSKIEVSNLNKSKIVEKYNSLLNLRFSNINRVSNRVLREENKEKLINYLDSINLDIEEYKEIDKKIVSLNKERNLRYI